MDTSSTAKVTPVYVISVDTTKEQQQPTTTTSEAQPMDTSEPESTFDIGGPLVTVSEISSTPVGQVQSTPGGSLFRQSEIPITGDTNQPSYTQGGVAPGSSPDLGPQGTSSEGIPMSRDTTQGGLGPIDQPSGGDRLSGSNFAPPVHEPGTQYTLGPTLTSKDVRATEPLAYESTASSYPPSSTTSSQPTDSTGKGVDGTDAKAQVTSSQYDQERTQNADLGTGMPDSSGTRGTQMSAIPGQGWSLDSERTGERDPRETTGSKVTADTRTGAGGETMGYDSGQGPQYSTTTGSGAPLTTQPAGFETDQARQYGADVGAGQGASQYGTGLGSGQGPQPDSSAGLAPAQQGTTESEKQFTATGMGQTQTPSSQAPGTGAQALRGVPYPAPAQPRKVIVLVDETSDSDNTVSWFSSTSMLPNDQIQLLHIHADKATDNERTKAETMLTFERCLSFFTQRGVSAEQLSSHVIPARRESVSTMGQALAKYLEATPADLLVMGHSEPTMTQKLVGVKAFSEYAIHHIDVPLLLVQKPKLKN